MPKDRELKIDGVVVKELSQHFVRGVGSASVEMTVSFTMPVVDSIRLLELVHDGGAPSTWTIGTDVGDGAKTDVKADVSQSPEAITAPTVGEPPAVRRGRPAGSKNRSGGVNDASPTVIPAKDSPIADVRPAAMPFPVAGKRRLKMEKGTDEWTRAMASMQAIASPNFKFTMAKDGLAAAAEVYPAEIPPGWWAKDDGSVDKPAATVATVTGDRVDVKTGEVLTATVTARPGDDLPF